MQRSFRFSWHLHVTVCSAFAVVSVHFIFSSIWIEISIFSLVSSVFYIEESTDDRSQIRFSTNSTFRFRPFFFNVVHDLCSCHRTSSSKWRCNRSRLRFSGHAIAPFPDARAEFNTIQTESTASDRTLPSEKQRFDRSMHGCLVQRYSVDRIPLDRLFCIRRTEKFHRRRCCWIVNRWTRDRNDFKRRRIFV